MIACTTFFMVVLSFTFAYENSPFGLFNPALGFGTGLMLVYNRRVFYSLLVGDFLGSTFVQAFFTETNPAAGMALVFLYTALFSAQLLVLHYAVSKLGLHSFGIKNLFRANASLLTLAALMALLGGLVRYAGTLWILPEALAEEYPFSFLSVGDFFGVIIVAPLTELVFVREKTPDDYAPQKKMLLYGVFYGLILMGIVAFSLLDVPVVLTRNLYLFILFFLTAALLFSYKAIVFLTLVVVVMLRWQYVMATTAESFLFTSITLLSFVYISTITTILLKRFKDLRFSQTLELKETTEALDNMLEYLRGFLSLSKDILTQNKSRDVFARRTFEIATLLFDADHFFSYFDNEGILSMVKARNYPIKNIPFLYDLHDANRIRKEDTIFHDDVHKDLKNRYGEEFASSHANGLSTFSRAYMVFSFTPQVFYVIGLDYTEKTLDESEMRRMDDFTKILNKLFEKNYATSYALELKDDTILTFVRALDLYDRYTKGHSEDVAKLSQSVAEHLNLSGDARKNMYFAGLLHDIGKLGVPYDILNKEDKLDQEEYRTVKQHVDHGFEILKNFKGMRPIATMIRHHHEWWNGQGYPQGLKGDDISTGGQILAAADAVATMATDRPYQKRRSKEEIIEELQRYKGTQFSPLAVDAIVYVLENDTEFKDL